MQDFTLHSKNEKPIVTMPVNIFLDDTSTTKSKRWLPLHCIQMQLSGTFHHMMQNDFVEFLTYSNFIGVYLQ